MANPGRSLLASLGIGLLLAQRDARGAEPMPAAAFFPDGMLGLQLGSSWVATKRAPALNGLTCELADGGSFDEVCFFRTANQVGGAAIHDGFIARKGDRVVLIGTGIAIKNADDPLAETVVRELESRVHAGYQHTGSNVLFVNMPRVSLSSEEMQGFARTAPVLLVEMEPKDQELAVLYGYLEPVNAFTALTAE